VENSKMKCDTNPGILQGTNERCRNERIQANGS